MNSDLDLTEEELELFEAGDLVKKTSNADDLVQLVVEDRCHWATRLDAAEKLIRLWEDGRQGGITLDHLSYVGDHADEPYKSRANRIIRDNI